MLYDFFSNTWRSEFWILGSAVVAFLVGVWVLRGAPPGQTGQTEGDDDAPRAGYRDRIVVAVVVGLFLIMGGAYAAIARGILWSLPIFAVGFGLVLTLISYNRRYRHASPSLRRTIDFSTVFLNASLLAGILIVVNVIAFRYGGQPLDLTREQTYSLSSMTINQLLSLDQPVTLTMVFGRGVRAVKQRERVEQLVESYKAVNPRMVQLDSINPYSDLTRGEELVKRVPELEVLQGGGVVIEYGSGEATRHVVVRNQDLFQAIPLDPARGTRGQFASAFTGEDEITSAIIRLKEGKKTTVAFTVGHGEPPTSDMSPRGTGIGSWKARLAKVGCDAVELNLVESDIPRDLGLLVVAGPKSPFKPEELAKLKGYAMAGRPMMLLLSNTVSSGLDELLKMYNLQIGSGLVIDRRFNFNRMPNLVFVPFVPSVKHPVVDPLGTTRAALMPDAAPIHLLGQAAQGREATEVVDPRLVPTPILWTSKYAWAESNPKSSPLGFDRGSGDEPAPLILGVAVSQRPENARPGDTGEGKPRLILFSSPAMAENVYQEIEQSNLDLLMNAASWLRNRPDTQGIAPHTHVALTLSVDPFLRSRLILVPSAVAAMLIVAMGLIVYIARRQ